MSAGVCAACRKQVEYLFRHHDHFSDFCFTLRPNNLKYSNEGNDVSHLWETFPSAEVCSSCNAICPEVKRNTSMLLPKFVSFSPDEMRCLLSGGLSQQRDRPGGRSFPFVPWSESTELRALINTIWAAKREAYRPYIKKLVDLGVTRDAISLAWNDRKVTVDTAQVARSKSRQEMLAAIKQLPQAFHELCERPGNDEQLAQIFCSFNISDHATSFLYWYHVRHGDSYLKKNHLGVGPMAFCDWFRTLCLGKVTEANHAIAERLRRERYWASR